MLIDTTRFGKVDVDDGKTISFTDGILGFPQHRRYALIQTSPDPIFFWLQSLEDPALAFVVCDPLAFVADYQAPIRQDDVQALGLRDLSDAQVLAICNKVDGHVTANLLGPIVVGAHSLLAKQLVLSDKRYSTRHRLMRLEAAAPISKTA